MKYVIDDYSFEGIIYKPIDPKELKDYCVKWKKSLTRAERRALRKYREQMTSINNINAKLRKGIVSDDAKIISSALQKAILPENIIVYRRLARAENNEMKEKEIGEYVVVSDFKGTHVGKEIKEIGLKGPCAGYMFLLLSENIHAAYINDLSLWHRNEHELLIDKNKKLLLLDKFKLFKKDGYVVKVQ